MQGMQGLIGQVVNLVILHKLYKRPPIRGYLAWFSDGDTYGIVTGSGYVQRVAEEDVLLIHEDYIILP